MTRQKHLKQRVRARMGKTGESYTAARRKVEAAAPQPAPVPSPQAPISGVHPETTALRILLAQAGGGLAGAAGPPSEAMVFGIAGGIGAGVFAFHYPKEDFQNFYLAGRHLWQDNVAYLKAACGRLGVEPEIREAGGAKAAAPPKIRAAWSRLDEIAEQMRTDFPLSPAEADDLLADLQGRIAAIHEQEIAGWEALGAALG